MMIKHVRGEYKINNNDNNNKDFLEKDGGTKNCIYKD